jgi:peptide/nickel transport system substrate-binding protein
VSEIKNQAGEPVADTKSPLTRRDFLRGSALAGSALIVGSRQVGAHVGTRLTARERIREGAEPRVVRGGTLRAALVGGGVSETLSPFIQTNYATGCRTAQLFDTLTIRSSKTAGEVVPGLAVSLEPNRYGTTWMMKLRPDVVFHNGKPFTADDVLYTWGYILDPKNSAEAASLLDVVDLGTTKKLNDLTIRVEMKRRFATLPGLLSTTNMPIIPEGLASFTAPIGTGPFEFNSFTAGQQSLFDRNPNYWMNGRPYVDSIEIVDIDDDVARFNALLGGQVDLVNNIDPPVAKEYLHSTQIKVYLTPATKNVPIYCRLDRPPFDDNRVRVALKLMANRKQLIEDALLGFGTVGNDLFGKGYSSYNSDLPQREHDPDKARSLLKAAGHSKLNLQLLTSTAVPGMLESAEVFAQEASGAGVKVNLKVVPASAYFDTSQYYLKVPFAQSEWSGAFQVNAPYAFLSNGAYNETAWKSASWNKEFLAAEGILDENRRNEKYKDLQVPIWEQGGYVIWGFQDDIDAGSPHVHGLVSYPDTSFFNYNFNTAWLG